MIVVSIGSVILQWGLESNTGATVATEMQSQLLGVHQSMDLPFVRCCERFDYERRFSHIVAALGKVEEGSFRASLPEAVGFSGPYDEPYNIWNWEHFAKKRDFEYQNLSGERARYMSG